MEIGMYVKLMPLSLTQALQNFYPIGIKQAKQVFTAACCVSNLNEKCPEKHKN